MKIGRNQPCPCGSGKKYKKCCMLKQQNKETENYSNTPVSPADVDNNDFDMENFFLQTINSMHKYVLEKKPHIREYKRIRKLHSEIGNNMTDYFYSGKFEQKTKDDYVFQNKHNIKDANAYTFLECEFDMETNVGVQAFLDKLLYKNAPNVNCITEEFIEKKHFRKPEKIEFLQSMLDSKVGLFEITQIDMAEGYAYFREVFTGSKYKITDIGLSGNKNSHTNYVYTRIITFHNVSFSTGLNFVFSKTDQFIRNFIKHHKKDYNPLSEGIRFAELYNRFSQDPTGIKVVTNTFK